MNRTCPKCSRATDGAGQYCRECGTPLSRAETANSPTHVYQTKLNATTRLLTKIPRPSATITVGPRTHALTQTRLPKATATRLTRGAPALPAIGTAIGEDKVLLIDVSGSMNDAVRKHGFLGLWTKETKLDAAKEGATGFIHTAIKQNDSSRIAIVAFSERAEILCDLVPVQSGAIALLNAVRRLAVQGGTDIGSGLAAVQDMLMGSTGRRRIELLSDGWDTRNSNPVAIASVLKAQGIFISTIGFGTKPTDVDENTLKAIASDLNGQPQYRFFSDPVKLADHITQTGVTRVDY